MQKAYITVGTLLIGVTLQLTTVVGHRASQLQAAQPSSVGNAEALYTTNCVICHGTTGEGNGQLSANLNPKPRNFKTDAFKSGKKDPKGVIIDPTPEQLAETIGKGVGTSMPPFAHLKADERLALAHYILFTLRASAKGKVKKVK